MQHTTEHQPIPTSRGRTDRRHSARRTHRRSAAAAFASIVLGASALAGTTANAAGPEAEALELEGTTRFAAGELCPFEIVLRETVRARITIWSDEGGEMTRGRIHIRGTTHVSSDHGAATNRWVENIEFDPATGTEARTGNSFNVHAGPGGVLVNDSGRIVADGSGELRFSAGPRGTDEEFEALCARLAEG
jgi:hypothetical protein